MTKDTIYKLISDLQEDFQVFAPLPSPKEGLEIKEVGDRVAEIDLTGKTVYRSFKKFFLPVNEKIFDYEGADLVENFPETKRAVLGMNILDLKALYLYELVFANDPYFQRRMKNTLVVGVSSRKPRLEFKAGQAAKLGSQRIFETKFDEEVLEHLKFDIFLKMLQSGEVEIITGSRMGREVLERLGVREYTNIQFAGGVQEGKLDARMVKIKKKMAAGYDKKIWEDLGKRCIECGKCTLVCPTCFCFRIDDQPGLKSGTGERNRVWDTCFYRDFSLVAGDHCFQATTAQKIFFWYTHKFVRIPGEFQYPGCVDCGRCVQACPVGINIREEIAKILTS